MKKMSLLLLAFSLSMGMSQAEAVTLQLGGPGVVFTNQQPIQVVVVDSNGNTYERTAYYNSATGGIEIDASWVGPNASIYIPSLSTGYLWYNGFWVNQEGYYWDNGRRVYVPDIPQWKTHWSGYWQHRGHDGRNWDHGDRHDHWWDKGDHWWNKDRNRDQMRDNDRQRNDNFDGRRFQREDQRVVPNQNLQQGNVQGIKPQDNNFRDRGFERRGERNQGDRR